MKMHPFHMQPNNRYSNCSPARRILRISFLLPEYLPAEFPFSSQEFIGYGNRTFEASIDVDYWTDILLDYTVRIEAIDAASNEIQMDKKIEGLFGGVLDFLEDIWNAIVGAVTAAWNALVEAVNWIVEFVMSMINSMLDIVLKPIINAMQAWSNDLVNAASLIGMKINTTGWVSQSTSALMFELLSGPYFLVLALATAVSIILMLLTPYTIAFSFLIGIAIDLIASLIISALASSLAGAGGFPELISSLLTGDLEKVYEILREFLGDYIHSEQWEVDLVFNLIGWVLAFASAIITLSAYIGKRLGKIEGETHIGDIKGMALSVLGISLATASFFAGFGSIESVVLSLLGLGLCLVGAILAKKSVSESKLDKVSGVLTLGGTLFGITTAGYSIFRYTLWN